MRAQNGGEASVPRDNWKGAQIFVKQKKDYRWLGGRNDEANYRKIF